MMPPKNDNAREQAGEVGKAKQNEHADSTASDARRKYVETAAVRLDGGTQPRCAICESTVAEYAEAMQEGANFPAVVVFFDGADYWLADGFHRYHATRKAGFPTILAEVHAGTRRDAMLYGFGANARHGLRETRADRRRKVEAMLRDDEWVMWSDREIARKCGVDHKTVAAVRAELAGRGEIPQIDARTVERAGAVYQQAARAADTDQTDIGRGEIPHVDTRSDLVASGEIPQIDARTVEQDVRVAHVGIEAPDNQLARAVFVETAPSASLQVEPIAAPAPDDCGPSAEEIAEAEAAEKADRKRIEAMLNADDAMAVLVEENKRLVAANAILQVRSSGLINEKAEAIRMAKYWKRRAETAEKKLAPKE